MTIYNIKLPELKLALEQISETVNLMNSNIYNWETFLKNNEVNDFHYEFSEIDFLSRKLSKEIIQLGNKLEHQFKLVTKE